MERTVRVRPYVKGADGMPAMESCWIYEGRRGRAGRAVEEREEGGHRGESLREVGGGGEEEVWWRRRRCI